MDRRSPSSSRTTAHRAPRSRSSTRCSGQVEAPPLEVVLVDDASTEPFPDPDGVTVVRRKTNGGFGAAVNTGVAVARGRTLTCCWCSTATW